MDGHWIPIMEYSSIRGISVSTIRRYIKSGHVRAKFEEGRYLVFVANDRLHDFQIKQKVGLELIEENRQLRQELKLAQEELMELKMLVDIYEQKSSKKSSSETYRGIVQ